MPNRVGDAERSPAPTRSASHVREGQFADTSDAPITSIHATLGAVDEWILKTSISRYGRSCVAYCAASILADCSRTLGT
jgi:hypothetical protein